MRGGVRADAVQCFGPDGLLIASCRRSCPSVLACLCVAAGRYSTPSPL